MVLEVLESNVKRGSQCYEQGHYVVLAYCESSRGIAQVRWDTRPLPACSLTLPPRGLALAGALLSPLLVHR